MEFNQKIIEAEENGDSLTVPVFFVVVRMPTVLQHREKRQGQNIP